MEFIQKHKKKIVIGLIALIILVVSVTILLFQSIATRINYSREQIIEIAENQIGGKVTEIDVEHEIFNTYYELTMIDENHQEVEVVIDASDGTIVEIDYDD